jgi:hypothetical protein
MPEWIITKIGMYIMPPEAIFNGVLRKTVPLVTRTNIAAHQSVLFFTYYAHILKFLCTCLSRTQIVVKGT